MIFKGDKITIKLHDEPIKDDIEWTKIDPPMTLRYMVSGSLVTEISYAEYERFVRANHGEFQ